MNLHDKQIELIDLLKKYEDNPLTIREIKEELELSSTSLVHHHITQLEKKGYLKRNPSNPRDYQILSDAEKPISYLNLYGFAKCGPEGIDLSGNPIERIPISSKLIPFAIEDACLVKALGDSMEPKIHEDDLIITKRQPVAENGDIVVCVLDGKSMIKRYSKNKDIVLESLNRDYFPIVVSPKNNTFRIEGIMRGIICIHEINHH
ncbi:MAG: HTH domain-containing protein [Saprospiraceae bacterium]|nr:HTH domain-containing protein [Saprospiraceae bacterium]MBP7699452.1 HTH domain-containing protein [Saprospiraceae bacterium]